MQSGATKIHAADQPTRLHGKGLTGHVTVSVSAGPFVAIEDYVSALNECLATEGIRCGGTGIDRLRDRGSQPCGGNQWGQLVQDLRPMRTSWPERSTP